MSIDELIELLVRNNDRVPRNVIDHCAARAEDRTFGWYIRFQAADVVIGAAMSAGRPTLDEALD